MKEIIVNDTTIKFKHFGDSEFISLTDIARWKNPLEPSDVVKNWLRSVETIEFLGLWEKLNNPNFNSVEFDLIKTRYGRNAFTMSPTQWTSKTGAIGIVASRGKYSEGTLAHEDIALEFLSWVSVEFKLHFIYEFKRLKTREREHLQWSVKRELAKVNYHMQTHAIQKYIVPTITESQKKHAYTDEADLLNVVLFGKTAKQWRDENPDKNHANENIRDFASWEQLLILSNMESYNSLMIKDKISQEQRMTKLSELIKTQLASLQKVNNRLLLPKN